MLHGDAKKEAERSRCLAPQQDAVDANWAGTCSDVAGFRDSEGRTCDEWADHPSWCIGSPEDGVYDPPSVYRNRDGIDASQACCVCKQSNLPLTGTTWHRDASGHEPAGQTMGEVHFCNQGLNALAAHSFRQLHPDCTPRMIQEKTCKLTAFDNRSASGDSIIFAGTKPAVLAFAGTYEGGEGSKGHMLLVLTGPDTLSGFTCSHRVNASGAAHPETRALDRCSNVQFRLSDENQNCGAQVKSTCELRSPDGEMLDWPALRAMRASDDFFSGGLGVLARKSRQASHGVWACVSNWNPFQELYCGAGPDRMACFQYEDMSQRFDFWGLNSDLRLVESKSERNVFK
jgi:hypothetical protein